MNFLINDIINEGLLIDGWKVELIAIELNLVKLDGIEWN